MNEEIEDVEKFKNKVEEDKMKVEQMEEVEKVEEEEVELK